MRSHGEGSLPSCCRKTLKPGAKQTEIADPGGQGSKKNGTGQGEGEGGDMLSQHEVASSSAGWLRRVAVAAAEAAAGARTT